MWRPDFSELSNIAGGTFISLPSLKYLARYTSQPCLIYFGIIYVRELQKVIPHRAMAHILGPQCERGIKDNMEEMCRAGPHLEPPYQHLERD